MKQSRAHPRCQILVGVIFVATMLGVSTAAAAPANEEPVKSSSLGPKEASSFRALLSEVVQTALGRQGYPDALRGVRLDKSNNGVVVELARGYLPPNLKHFSGELQDRLHVLTTEVVQVANFELGITVENVDYRFDGQALSSYYPEDFPDYDDSSPESGLGPLGGSGQIVVSAGHGKYLHHSSRPFWTFQRDPHFGVLEDQITQPLSSILASLISERGLHSALQARSTSSAVHAPSSSPWSDIAARYHLKELLPDRKDIWNSLPGATHRLRERDEDIRSRPRYANGIGASGLLSIHTNGHTTSTPRGTRVYYHQGRAVPREVGARVLCYMKEVINAQEGYEEFPVATVPVGASDKGENSAAMVPAIIVETAFHSNPDDAAALQDPVFQRAAMKGVEKGVRLYEEGEPCTPYIITDIPDIQGQWGSSLVIPIHYEGFPQYPVELEVELVSCPTTCTPGSAIIKDEVPSPVQVGFLCNGEPGSPVVVSEWRAHLKDDDGVKTQYDFTATCGTGGAAAIGTPDVPLFISLQGSSR